MTKVRRQVAVMLVTGNTAAVFAAKAATAAIPILFITGEDPVRLGLVTSLARPGGNLTGINFFNTELVAKQLALLHELVPRASRVAVFVNPANVTATESTERDAPPAARAIGLHRHTRIRRARRLFGGCLHTSWYRTGVREASQVSRHPHVSSRYRPHRCDLSPDQQGRASH